MESDESKGVNLGGSGAEFNGWNFSWKCKRNKYYHKIYKSTYQILSESDDENVFKSGVGGRIQGKDSELDKN